MPNIVFYIEIDYLSIDESKLLSSNKDNAKTKGALCPWKQMHTLCGFILSPMGHRRTSPNLTAYRTCRSIPPLHRHIRWWFYRASF